MPDDENEITDYRCSKCGEIGGDSQTGAYDGGPQGGKHDMAGGKV